MRILQSHSEMVDRRIKKIRKNIISLGLSGVDCLFVAELPDQPLGEGSCFLIGNDESPTPYLCARRTLRELKDHLDKIGLDFDYTVTRRSKE